MSLVGWWPLHDDTAQDLSGNGNHGTVNGATPGVAGRGGLEAMSFDATDDYIELYSSSDINPSNITVTAWVYPLDIDERVIAALGATTGSGDGILFRLQNDGISENSFTDVQGDTLPLNTWTHVSFSYDGSAAKIYIDGTLNASDNSVSGDITYDGNRADLIGSWETDFSTQRVFDGSICDVRIYNRALSESEIQTLYEWGSADLARPPTDGVAYYPLDGDATDEWGSNDGTVNGATVTDDSIRGEAYEFDGSDDEISISGSDNLDLANQSFSISAWTKTSEDSDMHIISKLDYVDDYGYTLRTDDNSGRVATFEYYDDSGNNYKGVYSTSTIINDCWYHVLVSYDNPSDEMRIYINGTLEDSQTVSAGLSDSDIEATIGGSTNEFDRNWDGAIDDVRIYDYTLSPSEVHELYRWGTYGRDMRQQTVNK